VLVLMVAVKYFVEELEVVWLLALVGGAEHFVFLEVVIEAFVVIVAFENHPVETNFLCLLLVLGLWKY
jgi:hypothetical protein